MLLNLFRQFSKFNSRSSVIFILKVVDFTFLAETVHVSSYPKTIQIAAVTTRLWNKDFIRILQRSYKPILSACFPLKTVGSNIFFELDSPSFQLKTTRFPVTMALVQEVHNRVHNVYLQHVIRGRSALDEMLRRIVAPNAVRSPRPVPSAVSVGSYPISVEHSQPSLDADWI